MVGQICREGIDQSGVLPKAQYAMTVGHYLEQQGIWGCCNAVSLLVGPGQSPGGGPEGEALSTKKGGPEGEALSTKKFMCKANISTLCSVISKRISW